MRELSFGRAFSILGVVILTIFFGYVYIGVSLELVMLLALMLSMGMAVYSGFSFDEVEKLVLNAIRDIVPLILILFSVGALIGSWIISGTVPAIIYAGLSIISPTYFLVTSVVLCMATSLATGTSWGTMGTMGVAMMGIGAGLNVDPAITAGAVISGAYFGDKLSPLSDSTNLAPAVAGSELIEHIRRLTWTTVPAIVLALIVFFFIGLSISGDHIDQALIAANEAQVAAIQAGILDNFNIGLPSIIPMVIVIGLLVMKKPAYTSIMLGALTASIMAVFYQNISLSSAISAMYNGFSIDTDIETLSVLLNRGGVERMYPLAALFMIAIGVGGVLSGTGIISSVIKPIVPMLSSKKRVSFAAIPMMIITLMIGASFSFAAVITGTIMKPLYDKFGIERKNLSRTIEDAGTVNDPTFPWSGGAIYASGVLGVATLDYVPYMFFAIFSILISILFAVTGFTITTKDNPKITLPWSK